jgi:hypothetical protein
MSKKLNQVLAVEKSLKQRVYTTINELDKVGQNAALFNGFSKTYEPINDSGTRQPPQSQKVAFKADELLSTVRKNLVQLFDVTATKDWGNQSAKADVVVEGRPVLTGVPATHLLFLKKQLTDLRTQIARLAELEATANWSEDQSLGLFKTEATKTHTTAKKQKALVLAPATDKHPAQTQMITEDEIVGEWTTIKFSGAIPATEKKKYLDRIQTLIDSVTVALQEANMTQVEEVHTGHAVLSYVFGS